MHYLNSVYQESILCAAVFILSLGVIFVNAGNETVNWVHETFEVLAIISLVTVLLFVIYRFAMHNKHMAEAISGNTPAREPGTQTTTSSARDRVN
jgi:hypothetical protein